MLFKRNIKEAHKEIIMVFSYYGIGGAQRRAVNLANSFVEKGYHVSIVALYGKDGSIQTENFYAIDRRVELIMLPEYFSNHNICFLERISTCRNKWCIKILKQMQLILRKNKRASETINWKIRNLRKSEVLETYLLNHVGAIVISFGFNIFDRVYLAAKKTRCKLIYAETNASDKYIQEPFFKERYNQIKKATAWVFQTKEQLNFYNMVTSNQKVIYNPISSSLPTPYVGDRAKKVVNFCRIAPPKNLILLINAFRIVIQKYPEYKLFIYGDAKGEVEKQYKDSLLDYIKMNNLEQSVFLMPATSKIHELILDASMFVSSSDYEGISNSMIEAMAIGLPCICTDCAGGGAKELIKNRVNGLIVPVNNIDALAEAMIEFINDELLREKCANNAAMLREKLKMEEISNEWLILIDRIM